MVEYYVQEWEDPTKSCWDTKEFLDKLTLGTNTKKKENDKKIAQVQQNINARKKKGKEGWQGY
jgi:hypothetical protein